MTFFADILRGDDKPKPAHTESRDDVDVPVPEFAPGEPETFEEVVGQEGAVGALRTAVEGARMTGLRLPHILLADRRPGVGKTTLAKVTAAEIGSGFLRVMGSMTVHEGARVLQRLGDCDILFWDEIHLARKVDWLLGYMDSPRSVILPSGPVTVPDVTIIAATTNPEKLSSPLVSRFVLRPVFVDYSAAEMEKMLSDSITSGTLRQVIVGVSDGNPRELRRMEQIASNVVASGEDRVVERVLEYGGYGRSGMSLAAEQVLLYLYDAPSFSASQATLRVSVGSDCEAAERFLLDKGLLEISGRGRQLTAPGIETATKIKKIYRSKS